MECVSVEKLWEKERDRNLQTFISQTGFWELLDCQHKLEDVEIPQTVVYKEGQLWRWFFTGIKGCKKLILKKNAQMVTPEKIISHFRSHKHRLEKLNNSSSKFSKEFAPFIVVSYCKNTVEKFNTYLNFAETENVVGSTPRTVSYVQEFVPSKNHFDAFSAPRYYCYLNGEAIECFKEVVEYKEPNQNFDSKLYREEMLDPTLVVPENMKRKEEFVLRANAKWKEEIEKVQSTRAEELARNGEPKPKPKLTKTFVLSEPGFRSQLIEVDLGKLIGDEGLGAAYSLELEGEGSARADRDAPGGGVGSTVVGEDSGHPSGAPRSS